MLLIFFAEKLLLSNHLKPGWLGLTPGQMGRQKDGWMERQMDRQMNGQTDGWTDREKDGRMYRWTDGQMDGWMDGQDTERERLQLSSIKPGVGHSHPFEDQL